MDEWGCMNPHNSLFPIIEDSAKDEPFLYFLSMFKVFILAIVV